MSRQFSGDPETIWIGHPGSDRTMALLQDFWFMDRSGKRWDAPKATIIDGASIPRALWSLVGSPYTGDYRRASIVHDVACNNDGGDPHARRAADRMFYEACRAGGCSIWEATVLYVGVRIGAWWGEVAGMEETVSIQTAPAPGDAEMQRDFQSVSEDVLRQGTSDEARDVEARTDAAIAGHLARKRALAGAALTGAGPSLT